MAETASEILSTSAAPPSARLEAICRRNSHFRDVAVMAVSSVGSQAIVVAVTPVLTRLYTTADFATFGLFMATTSMLGILSCGCYEQAVVTCREFAEAANALLLSLAVASGMSLLCFGVCIVWHGPLNTALGVPGTSCLVYFFPLAVFAIGYSEALKHWFVREARFADAASSRVWQSVAGSGVQVLMGYGRVLAGTGLVIGRVIGILVSGAMLQWRLRNSDLRTICRSISVREITSTGRRHKDFPLYLSSSLIMAQFAYWAPAYLLAIFYSAHVVGCYALIVRVISAPMQFVGDAFQKVLFQRAAEETNISGAPTHSVMRTLAALLALAAIPAVLLGLFGRPLFVFAFGRPWALAGDMAAWTAPVIFLNLLVCPLHPVFSIQKKQNVLFCLQLAKVTAAVLPVVAAGYLHLEVRTAMIGYSLGQSALFLITLLLALRYSEISPKTAIRRITRTYTGLLQTR